MTTDTDTDRRLRAHRRTELHVNWHGRDLRIVVFSWGIACSCRPGVDTYDCEHAKHARRILDEPCRVARVTHSLWLLDQALDTRTQEQVEKDAVRLLDSVSGVDRRPNILTERAAALRAAKEQP